MIEQEWTGCYSNKPLYSKLFDEDSNAHPAKMSWGLLERIFKELKKMGLLQEEDTILDFMAGTARTNIWAGLKGHKSISVELEPHFIEMQEKNKAAIESKFPKKWDWEMIQGDAREMSKLLQDKGLIGITSPPYGRDAEPHRSKPMEEWKGTEKWGGPNSVVRAKGYEGSEKNIANLPDKGLVGITSPPYVDKDLTGEGNFKSKKNPEGKEARKNPHEKYSSDLSNIGNLKDGGIVGITSPPYIDSDNRGDVDKTSLGLTVEGKYRGGVINRKGYSNNSENIGNQKDETYTSAMASVYTEAAKVCKVLVTVTKNPTRAGKLRRLDLDTIQLCRQAGFEPIAWFRARLFEKQEQATLDKGKITKYKGRISFFKRLSLDKGNVAADCEDIIIFVNKNDGELVGVTSPPYSEAQSGGGIAIDGYRGEHMDKQGKNQPDKVGERCGYMKEKHGSDPKNIANLPDKQ